MEAVLTPEALIKAMERMKRNAYPPDEIWQKKYFEPTQPKEINMSRAYESYTLADVNRLKGGFMKRTVDKDKLPMVLDRVTYLIEMARSNPQLMNAPFIDTFMVNQETPVVDIPELNKRAFEFLENFTTDNTEEIAILDASVEEYTKQYAEGDLTSLKEDISRQSRYMRQTDENIRRLEDDIASYYRSMADYSKKRDELEERLRQLEDAPTTEHWVFTEARKIVADGKWKLYTIEGESLKFVSRERIICRYYNPAAGIDKSVDMGYFKLIIGRTGKMSCYGVHDTINHGSSDWQRCEHPHVNRGSICWGNMGTRVSDNRAKRDLLSNVRLLDQLLITYSADNPYVKFGTFQRNKNNRRECVDERIRKALGLAPLYQSTIDEYTEKTGNTVVEIEEFTDDMSGRSVLVINRDVLNGPREQIGRIATIRYVTDLFKCTIEFSPPLSDGQTTQSRHVSELMLIEEKDDE